jgi:hypothetical protein
MELKAGMVFKTKNGTRFILDQIDPNDGGTWTIKHIISDNEYIASQTFFRGSGLEEYLADNQCELDVAETKKRIFDQELNDV